MRQLSPLLVLSALGLEDGARPEKCQLFDFKDLKKLFFFSLSKVFHLVFQYVSIWKVRFRSLTWLKHLDVLIAVDFELACRQSVSQSVSTFAILIWLALDEMVKKRKYLYLCIFFLNMIYFLLAERSTLPWQTALDPERPQVFGPSQAAHSKHLEVAWPLERDIPMIMHWISFCESRIQEGLPTWFYSQESQESP